MYSMYASIVSHEKMRRFYLAYNDGAQASMCEAWPLNRGAQDMDMGCWMLDAGW